MRTLTFRESEIVKRIAIGQPAKEVAHFMGISYKTVCTHRHNAMRKLDLHSLHEVIMYAISKGMIPNPFPEPATVPPIGRP